MSDAEKNKSDLSILNYQAQKQMAVDRCKKEYESIKSLVKRKYTNKILIVIGITQIFIVMFLLFKGLN